MLNKRPTGKVNPVGLAMLAALLGAIYYAVIFAPVYVDNIDAKEAVVAAYNQVGLYADDRVLVELKGTLRRIGNHRELNDAGDLVEVPGLGVADEDIVFERTPDGMVTIQVSYVREVRLAPSNTWRRIRFSPKKAGPVLKGK